MAVNYDYAITLKDVDAYGKVKVLFGVRGEYCHDDNGTFVIDVDEVKTRTQYKSLRRILEQRNYI
jgi:hypothetical protein